MESLFHSGENKKISKMHVCCLLVLCFSFSFCGTSEQCLSPFLTHALTLSDEKKEPIGSQQEIIILLLSIMFVGLFFFLINITNILKGKGHQAYKTYTNLPQNESTKKQAPLPSLKWPLATPKNLIVKRTSLQYTPQPNSTRYKQKNF